MRIVVCVTVYATIRDRLASELPDDMIANCPRDAAADADVLVPINMEVPASAFTHRRVRLVQQCGVGLDSVGIAAPTAAGVLVANEPSPGSVNAECVAELAVAHMLMIS